MRWCSLSAMGELKVADHGKGHAVFAHDTLNSCSGPKREVSPVEGVYHNTCDIIRVYIYIYEPWKTPYVGSLCLSCLLGPNLWTCLGGCFTGQRYKNLGYLGVRYPGLQLIMIAGMQHTLCFGVLGNSLMQLAVWHGALAAQDQRKKRQDPMRENPPTRACSIPRLGLLQGLLKAT